MTKAQYALQLARDLYAQVDLGIRRVEWGRIPIDETNGFADVTSLPEAVALTIRFSGRPGAIDVFLIQTMGKNAGRAPLGGPCSKDSLVNMSGCVIELAGSPRFRGIAIGHEIGHYLGLGHETASTNIMCGPVIFRERCDLSLNMTNITTAQAAGMKDHCMVNP